MAILLSAPANATPEQDQRLEDGMAAVGVELWDNGPAGAYEVCLYQASGVFTNTDLAEMVWEGNPSWSYFQAATFVTLASYIYCSPEEARYRA